MQWFTLIIIFSFGLTFGSFLNVLIDRLPKGISPFHGRSQCDYCKKTLSPADLIPVISFLILRGRCRYCHKALSWQYPILELFTGLMFVILNYYSFIIYHLSFSIYFCLLIIFSSLLVIFVADLKYQIIPDLMLVAGSISAIVYLVLIGQFDMNHIVSASAATMFFAALHFGTHGRGMGFGDVKFVAMMGLLLGFPGIVVGLYIAFLTGAFLSTILVIIRVKKIKQRIAFGPFLVAGTVIAFFHTTTLVEWYTKLFLK
ncbi:MAG: prepilin peptidase [Patescibacteria group bacterium]